jgi:hypothetical protein
MYVSWENCPCTQQKQLTPFLGSEWSRGCIQPRSSAINHRNCKHKQREREERENPSILRLWIGLIYQNPNSAAGAGCTARGEGGGRTAEPPSISGRSTSGSLGVGSWELGAAGFCLEGKGIVYHAQFHTRARAREEARRGELIYELTHASLNWRSRAKAAQPTDRTD